MRIQTKTTLLFTLLTVAVFLILSATVYYLANQYAYSDFYKRLELRARISAKFTFEQDHISTESFKQIQKQYLEKLVDERSYFVKLDSNNNPLLPFPARLPKSYLQGIALANGNTVFHKDNLVHYAGLLYKDETGNFLVIESATNRYALDILVRLRNILIITLVIATIIIYTVGKYFSKQTFEPFRKITSRVQTINENNLQLRLDDHEGTDEISELINTFNKMLDRMQTAFETQNNFVSHASHELRTPLTAIVAEADFALSKERAAEDYQRSLQQIMLQAEKLQQLTRGLLSLAQTSFDGSKQQWERVRVDELLFDVKANVASILPASNIIIDIKEMPADEEAMKVFGNYDLLKAAIGNIVLNGCKYSNNAPVKIELFFSKQTISIQINDEGIGIPEKELQNIYDPFFRASNTKGFEGYGIGLPLSQKIIRLHKGSLVVASIVNKGTFVTVKLPASS